MCIFIYLHVHKSVHIYTDMLIHKSIYTGCDHGRLSVGLSGHCSHVYAIDVSARAIQGICVYIYI
jgi:hypothetical protein